ncbi:MAG: Gfo/Idh/MocA family oxidoreductase [Candidatus Saccharicenans sp.]|nr:Gfo/Idh/MocA family oxidoreductase [Candidatus Saccharicenans sp.]
MINVGIIGFGYWGPNVARNFNASPEARLTAICDLRPQRMLVATSTYPFIKSYTNPDELIKDPEIDVVAVVTPVSSHYDLARKALLNGKHVFVEKPFTLNSQEAEDLIELAAKKNLKIMVDHTFLFTGAVTKMKELIDSGELGNILFYDSVRVNLGLFQQDVNVVWDLAPHDFSIMCHLIKDKPVAVSAQGVSHYNGDFEDLAYITVYFNDPHLIAHFHVNWLSPVKVRRTIISGNRKMLLWDDISADEKVKIYDRGVELKIQTSEEHIHNMLINYRIGDVYVPRLEPTEALKKEIDYFIECLQQNKEPFNNGQAGLMVVKLLEASNRSIAQKGHLVKLTE